MLILNQEVLMNSSINFSGNIPYQSQINPVVVKKQLQISLDSNQGALGLLEPYLGKNHLILALDYVLERSKGKYI